MATRTDRLAEIVRLLWEKREFGASAQEIGKSLGLKSRTYLTNLLKELINEGVAVAQQNIAGRGALYYAAHSSIKKVAGIASPTPAYFPIDAWIFDNDHCFLCGILLNMQNRTEEHVFPRWLQKRYNLSNERLTLQNGTSIPYRQLTIPCCQTCNRDYLSPLEQTIQNAHDRGFAAFSKLPRLLVFQWLAKIYYGILFRELSLLHDRSDPSLGFIFSQDQLKDFGTLHHFLQSVRLPFVFRGFQPWSIFLLKTISFNDQRNFDP